MDFGGDIKKIDSDISPKEVKVFTFKLNLFQPGRMMQEHNSILVVLNASSLFSLFTCYFRLTSGHMMII